MSNNALPDHLKGKLHSDYIFPFCYIPRSWTSWLLTQPPKLIWGYKVNDWTSRKYSRNKKWKTLRGPDPCQKTPWGMALTWPFHICITFGKSGIYVRFGCRWDTVDSYYSVPAAFIGRVDGGYIDKNELRITYRGFAREDI